MRQLNDDYSPEQALRVINRMVPANTRSYVSIVTGVALSSVSCREPRMEIGYTVYVNFVKDHHTPFLHCEHVGPLNETTTLTELCGNLAQKIDAWAQRGLSSGAGEMPLD